VFQEKIIDNTFFILNSDTIFLKVDKKACYLPKCESSLEAHISKYKRKLEEDDIEYKLGLSFIIFKNGSAKYCGIHTQFYDMRYINSCTAIFNNMESWNPAIKNAKTVSSVYGVIINFSEE
jgi:hypothetical protein